MKSTNNRQHKSVTTICIMPLLTGLAFCIPTRAAEAPHAEVKSPTDQSVQKLSAPTNRQPLQRQRAVSQKDFNPIAKKNPVSEVSRAKVAPTGKPGMKPTTKPALPTRPIKIPASTTTRDKTDQAMKRELLWRSYPTDQRGSEFRRFWDSPEKTGEKQEKSTSSSKD